MRGYVLAAALYCVQPWFGLEPIAGALAVSRQRWTQSGAGLGARPQIRSRCPAPWPLVANRVERGSPGGVGRHGRRAGAQRERALLRSLRGTDTPTVQPTSPGDISTDLAPADLLRPIEPDHRFERAHGDVGPDQSRGVGTGPGDDLRSPAVAGPREGRGAPTPDHQAARGLRRGASLLRGRRDARSGGARSGIAAMRS